MKRSKFSGYDVPGELVEQILLKLPVKSLVRFRSVCKDWKALITSLKFVEEHRQLQAGKPSSSLLLGWVRTDIDDRRQALHLVTVGDSVGDMFIKEDIDVPTHFLSPSGENNALLSFYCDGILCLVNTRTCFGHRIAFCNPALREYELVRTVVRDRGNGLYRCSGFGRDLETHDYKFVSIKIYKGINRVEVYTLRTGVWREIQCDTCWNLAPHEGAYLKGRLYWVSNNKVEDTLVWFDLSDESFGTMDLPRPRQKWTAQMPLLVWDGSLVYFNKVWEHMEMWVMDGEAGGWSKYIDMGDLPDAGRALAFWKEDELLINWLGGTIMSYSFSLKMPRSLPFPTPGLPYSVLAALYTETLVSVHKTTTALQNA